MFDKEFLKTLNIIYVEDDEKIRSSLSAILSKVLGNVFICADGEEGLEQFKSCSLDKQIHIDAIISDINMPNMNGIDMIKEIRSLDEEIPVIFTTAHGEANYLMDAIKLKVAHYALKPIDTPELLQTISKLCTIEHNKQLLLKKTTEISQYIDIMHHISAIFKVNTKGEIIESNTMLSQLSEYSDNELNGMTINSILHKDALLTTYNDIEQIVQTNSLYKGKLKFISKNNNAFYLNTTVLPIFNDSSAELEGYIYIGIDQTNDELEKQQTMQRVRKNIMQQRTKESDLQNRINELEKQLDAIKRSSLSSKDTKIIMDKLTKEKNKVINLNNQIEHYEEKFRALDQEKKNIEEEYNIKRVKEQQKKQETNKETHQLQSKVIELQAKLTKLESKSKSSKYA